MGDRVTRKRGFPGLSRASTSVTLHLAPSARGSDLVQADPRCKHRSGPMALGVEQARHTHLPSARARHSNGRQEHQEDSSWLHSSGLRPASAGGAGCPGCGQHPKTAPRRHTEGKRKKCRGNKEKSLNAGAASLGGLQTEPRATRYSLPTTLSDIGLSNMHMRHAT